MTEMYNGFRLETPETCEYEMNNMESIWDNTMKSIRDEEISETNPDVDINAVLKEYKQYKTMQAEIEGHIKELGETIKTFMDDKKVDTYYADQFKVVYKTVERHSVNTDLLKNRYPDVYNAVKATVITRPLRIF